MSQNKVTSVPPVDTKSGAAESGLHPRYSVDPAIFDLEKRNLFSRSWFAVGHRTEWPNTGVLRLDEILGRECLLVKDESRIIRCFENVCRHRCSRLCNGTEVTQDANHLVCQYHGWKYALDGSLVAAPHMQETSGFDRNDFQLVPVPCVEWNDWVFVRAGFSPASADPSTNSSTDPSAESSAESKPVDDPFSPVVMLDRLASVVTDREWSAYRSVRSISYTVQANWKLLFQNYSECYHCPSVHPQLTPLSDYRVSSNHFAEGALLGGPMKIRDGVESVTEDGGLCGSIPDSLSPDSRCEAHYYTLFPTLFVSLFPDYVMLHRLCPLSHRSTRVECDFLFHPETLDSPNFDPGQAARFWDLTNCQDWEMCERVQRGLETTSSVPAPYSNMEGLLSQFDQYYRKVMDLG